MHIKDYMETIKVEQVSKIRMNPDNPRFIKDEKYKRLVKSIKDFPEMLKIRPIVVNKELVVLGGNMRLKACKEAGLKEVPILIAEELTKEQEKEFIIKDNVSFGDWDLGVLREEWDITELDDWGLDLPDFLIEPNEDELVDDEDNQKPPTMKITFSSVEQLQAAEIEISELLDRKYKGSFFSISAGDV